MNDDLISRQAAIDALNSLQKFSLIDDNEYLHGVGVRLKFAIQKLEQLPSAQYTVYGYNVEHLEMIARVLQKENVPPERVVEILTDIGRIVAIVCDEFEESLRKAVE